MGIQEGGRQIFYRFKGGRDQKSLRTTGVEGEEQWGENSTLRGASADGESSGCEFAQPH